jgi:hypothetical protein
MKKVAAAALIVFMSACTANQATEQSVSRWEQTGNTTIGLQQAYAECQYEVAKDPRSMDRLFAMSGQPMIQPDGSIRGLSGYGMQMFRLCMGARGYRPAGAVPVAQAPK